MKKIYWIDGGAGRVISAIPALIKYTKLNPDSDFAIIVAGWESLYWGIPELQDRTYGIDTKGLFDNVIKNAEQFITPEPYRNPAYYRQEISLSQAFDREINNTTDHSDLMPPIMIFNKIEREVAKTTVLDVISMQKRPKTVMFQPFGRGAKLTKELVLDEESRSFSSHDYLILGRKLSQRYNIIFFGEPDFQLKADTFSSKFTCDLRQWGALIKEVDYFIGCDSAGQHMARAVNTPGTVIFGSTYAINTSYPDYFNIIDNNKFRKYSPIRLTGLDAALANRLNESTMTFDDKELTEIFNKIVVDIERKVK